MQLMAKVQQNVKNVTRGLALVLPELKQLQKEKGELDNKLKAVEENLQTIESCQQKMNQLMAESEEMKVLPEETKATASMHQNVEKKMADLKEEGETLKELIQRISLAF